MGKTASGRGRVSRYYVVRVTGWLDSGVGGGGLMPGVSATVMDDLTGKAMRTYRSENVRGEGIDALGRRAQANADAIAYATELNRQHRLALAPP